MLGYLCCSGFVVDVACSCVLVVSFISCVLVG